ncbi:hypothetical protein Nmel_003617, partial [Mimus melanotis]
SGAAPLNPRWPPPPPRRPERATCRRPQLRPAAAPPRPAAPSCGHGGAGALSCLRGAPAVGGLPPGPAPGAVAWPPALPAGAGVGACCLPRAGRLGAALYHRPTVEVPDQVHRAARGHEEDGRPRPHRPHPRAGNRRGTQAALPHDRLPAPPLRGGGPPGALHREGYQRPIRPLQASAGCELGPGPRQSRQPWPPGHPPRVLHAGRLTSPWWPAAIASAGSLPQRTCSQGTASRTRLTLAGWQVHARARGSCAGLAKGSSAVPCPTCQLLSSSVSQRRGCIPTRGSACWHADLQPGEPPWEGSTVHPGSWYLWGAAEKSEWDSHCAVAFQTAYAGAGDLCGHGGPCVQCGSQQAGDREGGPEPLAGQAPTHGLVAPQGWLGWAQDQASPTHEKLCQPATSQSSGVMPGANKAFFMP